MSYTITKQEYLDPDYHGCETTYTINFVFEKQAAEVLIQIDDTDPCTVRLVSNTDGYHWLHYFLSQEDNAAILRDFSFDEGKTICKQLFKSLDIEFVPEDKESAWLNLRTPITQNVVEAIAKLIEPKFANRERFFKRLK